MGSWRFSNFYFFYFSSVGIIVPYWSLYLQHLQFTAAEIGELTAILVLTKVVAPNIWGSLADRMNVRSGNSLRILRWATGGSLVIFCVLYLQEASGVGSLATNYWLMALVLLGYSVFWNACMPQVEAATLNHLAGERYRYGSIRLWGSVGFIVTVLGMGYVMDHTGPSIILHAGAFSFFALFVASFFLSSQAAVRKADTTIVPLRQLLNRRVVLILVLCTLMQASHAPFYTFFSIYLESYDYSKSHIGWLWTIGVIFEIGIFILGYRLLRQYRLINLLTFTFAVAALRWFMLAQFPESVLTVWAAQILHAITYGLNHSVMMQLIDQFFQGRYQVRGQALYLSMSFGIGGAIGSAGSGYIWSALGANQLFFVSAALMLVVTLFSYFFLTPKEEQIPIKTMN
ncbi:MAG: MFS transporter [Pseudomonadota bacterium]